MVDRNLCTEGNTKEKNFKPEEKRIGRDRIVAGPGRPHCMWND
jgi:hypothetical protein